jgi:peptidoglycan hydrolase CwlO-like protein
MQDKLDESDKAKSRFQKDATKALSDLEALRKDLTAAKEDNTKLLKRVEELGREVRDLKLQ